MDSSLPIRSLAELETFALRRRTKNVKIDLQVPGLAIGERSYWTMRLNQYRRACGCEVGSVACVLALVGFILFVLLHNGPNTLGLLSCLFLGFGIVIAAGVLGKALGLLYARYRLSATLSAIRKRLNSGTVAS